MPKQAEKENMKKKTMQVTLTLVTTAFGLVAALAWNTAIQNLFVSIFGTASNLVAMFGYAVLITIVAVVATVYLARLAAKQ